MNARRVALLLTAALAVYLVLLAGRGITLIRSGVPVGVALGVAILVLPVLGAGMVTAEWRFGMRVEQLARRLDEEGGLPDTSHLPRRPSGRVDLEAADAYFEERRAEVEADPQDWRGWFRLAHAYDLAGDRSQARAAMRKAIELAER
ncbi:MAG TPA: tetratricopeptide repeat protein [Pseudonocardiaceae bacterium]